MLFRRCALCCFFSIVVMCGQAFGWGADGHHTVGAIADKMIPVGSHAAKHVKAILGDLSLRDASVWADCAKGIDPRRNYEYQPGHPECKIFETPEGEEEMRDFVRRNDKNCSHGTDQVSCHTLYHYTDVAIQRDHYDPGFVGTRNDDIVNALVAAIHVLKKEPAAGPFKFRNSREALLLLCHYVGDIHQPLHVGAVYLQPNGNLVDPDAGVYKEQTNTHGGNLIAIDEDKVHNLHRRWDDISETSALSRLEKLKTEAETIPVTGGRFIDWPRRWANDTLREARQAFTDIEIRRSNQTNGHWNTTLSATYIRRMNDIKEKQLVKAGARLAQLLEAIWP